jgi:hypothetical protein
MVRTRAKKTLGNWDHLFTFLKYEGVDPTKNLAEQKLLPAVQWRRICFGSQSSTGLRFTERLLTIVGMCRINGISPFNFLVEVIANRFSGKHTFLTTAFAELNLPDSRKRDRLCL